MKKFNPTKTIVGLGLIAVATCSLLTLVVGNFFIDYALVPNSGGEDRQRVNEEPPEGVEEEHPSVKQTVAIQKKKEADRVDQWLQQTNNYRKDVQIESQEGLTLRGHAFFQPQESKDWVVLVHGYQADEASMYPLGHHYYEAGYHVLTFDQRSSGQSQGDYITMGIKEKDDLINWLQELIYHHPQAQIVVHGESMGASTALLASGDPDFPNSIVSVISDSAYSGVWDIFESELFQRFKLPAFPVLHMASIVAIGRVGINFFQQGDVQQAVSQSTTPTLFIHGTADDFVPFPMVKELYAAHPIEDKTLEVVEGAEHTDPKYLHTDRYYNRIFDFIDSY